MAARGRNKETACRAAVRDDKPPQGQAHIENHYFRVWIEFRDRNQIKQRLAALWARGAEARIRREASAGKALTP